MDDRFGDLDLRNDSDIPEVPPSTDSTPEILKRALSGVSARYSKVRFLTHLGQEC